MAKRRKRVPSKRRVVKKRKTRFPTQSKALKRGRGRKAPPASNFDDFIPPSKRFDKAGNESLKRIARYKKRWAKLYAKQQSRKDVKQRTESWRDLRKQLLAENAKAEKPLRGKSLTRFLNANKRFFARLPERWIRTKTPGLWTDRLSGKEKSSSELMIEFRQALRERLVRAFAQRKQITIAKARKEISRRIQKRIKGKKGKARARALNRAFTLIVRVYGSRD